MAHCLAAAKQTDVRIVQPPVSKRISEGTTSSCSNQCKDTENTELTVFSEYPFQQLLTAAICDRIQMHTCILRHVVRAEVKRSH